MILQEPVRSYIGWIIASLEIITCFVNKQEDNLRIQYSYFCHGLLLLPLCQFVLKFNLCFAM